jgi:4-hydroxybenzoate polyprenyltransferase
MRPRQWTKNLVVYAALIFSLQLEDLGLLAWTTVGFFVFCALSGAIYLLNDLKDREKDQLHPAKRDRPIAAGRLGTGAALIAFAVLVVGALGVAAWIGSRFLGVAIAFVVLNALYSFVLRSRVLLDVMAIAGSFVLRALAGAELLHSVGHPIRISPWLILCTFFLSLFLALGKRRHELRAVDKQHRRSLERYSIDLVDRLTSISIAVTLLSYSLYTIWPETVEHFGTERLLYTIPFVFYGLGRYLYLVIEEDKGGDPSEMLLTDRSILVTVVLWVIAVFFIVYRS